MPGAATTSASADVRTSCTRLLSLIAGVALLVAVGCACSGDDNPSRPTTTEARPRSTTTSSGGTASSTGSTGTTDTTGQEPSSVEDEIIARYKGFWEARFEANSPPNPDAPALREYATGDQLSEVIAETRANLDAGVEWRRRDEPAGIQRVQVISVSGDAAVVQECFVDDALVVRRDTGEVVNDTIATHNVRGEMRRVGGEWRLARAELIQRWEGVAGCALAS